MAIDVTITIGNFSRKIIEKQAADVNKTPRKFIEDKIRAWSLGQFDAYYIEKVNSLSRQEKIALLGEIN